ncbi:14247_t:CDS:2, partial [Cetraspora pellucida]
TAMIIWVNQTSSASIVLSDKLVKLKDRKFSNYLGIPENDLNKAASVLLETLADKRIKLRQLLSQYEPENIYNANETDAPEMATSFNKITNNRDQRPEDNVLDSENENRENFISESSENDEISNSEGNEDDNSNAQPCERAHRRTYKRSTHRSIHKKTHKRTRRRP